MKLKYVNAAVGTTHMSLLPVLLSLLPKNTYHTPKPTDKTEGAESSMIAAFFKTLT